MLFRAFDTYILRATQPRSMPHLATYIRTLNTRRGFITDRYANAAGYESPIVVLLRQILADADIPALLRKTSDLDCYLDVLIYTARDLNGIFDAVTTGLSFTNTVIQRNPTQTEEFLIPVRCEDPTTQLPFDRGWEAWQQVKPIRLVDLDSMELTFHTYQDQIAFSRSYPSRAVFTIDVVALVLQYVNFLRSTDVLLDQPEYLHRYVLIHLLADLQDNWLGNVYEALLYNPLTRAPQVKLDLTSLMGDQYYGFVGSELPIALQELQMLISYCARGAVTPAVLIHSLLLSHTTLPAFLTQLLETTTLTQQRQNYWMEYLRDIRWLSILYRAYQLQPDFVATRNLHTALKRDIPLIINTKFWNNCHSAKVRNFIEHDIQQRLLHMT